MIRSSRFRFPLLVAVLGLLIGGVPLNAQNFTIVLPTPTGEYPVSRSELFLVDETREETFTQAEGDRRELVVTLFYPAAAPAAPAPYLSASLRDAIGVIGIPTFLVDSVTTHSGFDQRAAEGEFPVLLFSPGYGIVPQFYTTLLEEVASHGYVIAAIAHPYGVGVVAFPDGRVLADTDVDTDVAGDISIVSDIWAADMGFVLSQLEQIDDDHLLAGHLDLEHVGAFGHSLGGAAAAALAFEDARIDAALNMDGALWGEVAENALRKPFMVLREDVETLRAMNESITDEEFDAAGTTREQEEREVADMIRQFNLMAQDSQPGYNIVIAGTTHLTFTLDILSVAQAFPLLVPPETYGELPGLRAVEIIRGYTVAFFDQHLKGQPSALLDSGDATFSEVAVEIYGDD